MPTPHGARRPPYRVRMTQATTEGHAALLRGINVGGSRKVPMARLREVFARIGYPGARTFIQSGNVVIDSDAAPADLVRDIESAIADEFGRAIPVLLRTHPQLDDILAHNPFAGDDFEPSKLAVAFCAEPLPTQLREALAIPEGLPERLAIRPQELLIYYPERMGRSKLDRSSFWKPLKGTVMTVRNWRTTGKLRDMLA